jgi:hypothetical protein
MPSRTAKANTTRYRRLMLIVGIPTALATVIVVPVTSVSASTQQVGVADTDAASSNQWRPRPPLRVARAGLDVVTVGGQILATGGFAVTERGVEVFDVVEARSVRGAGSWHDLAPLPTPRANATTAEVGGLVYAVGGVDAGDNVLSEVAKFDPRTGRWTAGVPLPQPRHGVGAAGLDGLLYVAGGEIWLGGDNFEVTNSMLVFNPRTNVWRSLAPMPTARLRHRLVASGGYLYAIAGLGDFAGPSLATVERYDPRTNRWTTMNSLHESRILPGAVATTVGRRSVLVVVGGVVFDSGGGFGGGRRTTEVFDIASGQWKLLDVLLPTLGRGSLGCATEADGTVLAIGGGTSSGGPIEYVDDVDALVLTERDLR